MSRSPRLYQPAWNQLKANPAKSLRIAAPNKHHRRIFKAIKKEKWMDTVYALLLLENAQTARLHHRSEAGLLEITLTVSLGIDEVTLITPLDKET